MIREIHENCDRCGDPIDGCQVIYEETVVELEHGEIHFPDSPNPNHNFEPGDVIGNSGFYRTEASLWDKYTNDGEEIVCEECLESDPAYKEDFC